MLPLRVHSELETGRGGGALVYRNFPLLFGSAPTGGSCTGSMRLGSLPEDLERQVDPTEAIAVTNQQRGVDELSSRELQGGRAARAGDRRADTTYGVSARRSPCSVC